MLIFLKGYKLLFSIERFWRDLWTGCTQLYYSCFYSLEDLGILCIDNELHMQALHIVYLPKIQASLDSFVQMYIRRPIRSANNQSPLQMWIMGQALDPYTCLTSEVGILDYICSIFLASQLLDNYLLLLCLLIKHVRVPAFICSGLFICNFLLFSFFTFLPNHVKKQNFH